MLKRASFYEHSVILEIIRRIRALNLDYKVYYWRTGGGAEVDCVIDTGSQVIPIEIKAGTRVMLSELRGLRSFMDTYNKYAKHAYVITNGRVPERISSNITAIPWRFL